MRWNRIVGSLVMGWMGVVGAQPAPGVTWDGGGTDDKASNPTNWVGDAAPSAGSAIVFDTTSQKAATWDPAAPSNVASWSQVGYTNTIVFMTVNAPGGFTNFTIGGNCVISNGAWTHTNNAGSTNMLRVTINGSLTLGPGGTINVSGRSSTSAGPGTPIFRSGGSYGGVGGRVATGDGSVGNVYGSVYAPTNLGSRGGIGYLSTLGGGALQLTVGGALTLDGWLLANAAAPAADSAAGSGGSILLTAGTLGGVGGISAAGGGSLGSNGSGGGGRIAVILTGGATLGGISVDASGGRGAGNYGAAGTVYLRMQGEAEDAGTLIVANTNASAALTLIGPSMTGTAFGNVVIRNLGLLGLASNQSISFSGIWSNGASFFASSGSTVWIAGPAGSTSTVYGTSVFQRLSCTNAGKWIAFPAVTNRVVESIWLRGAPASKVVLRGTNASPWFLRVDPSADQSVHDVDVADSDARPGAAVTASGSVSNGVNRNWFFIAAGETNTWTGATNSLWSNGTNWNRGRMPADTDVVVIPAGTPRYPVLDGDRVLAQFQLAPGATLTLAGRNLGVTGAAALAGALVATGYERLTLGGDADFTGATVTPAFSTMLVNGQAGQAVNAAGKTFYTIQVANVSTTVTFNGGLTAKEFRCETGSGEIRLAFQAGTTVVVRDFVLEGTATKRVFLRSTSPGTAWNLNVTGYDYVRGADAQDCDASAGSPVRPISDTVDSDRNANWVFDAPWAVWKGTNSASFLNRTNWVPQTVPTAGSLVLVEVTNTLSITSPAAFKAVYVGGSVPAVMQATTTVTVAENLVIRSSGTASFSQPVVVSNHVCILNGGLMTHAADARLLLTVGRDLYVDPAGSVDASSKGPSGGIGYPSGSRSGGSYGGQGAYNANGDGAIGKVYGSITAPTNSGSWGGRNGGGYSTQPGGALLLTVGGTAVIEGRLLANGGTTFASYTAGGSGGSVFLVAAFLSGAGAVQANGGTQVTSGGGGGGRIAVWLTNSADFGAVTYQAYGAGPSSVGAAGTIYLRAMNQAENEGTLIVDHNLASAQKTLIGPLVTNTTVGSVMVRNLASFSVDTNLSVGFSQAWSNSASFTGMVGSVVSVVGGGTATLYGATTFQNLSCLVPGKTIRFAGQSTNRISAGLNLQGSVGLPLKLRSTADGVCWRLNVMGTVVQAVSAVDAKDSDASPGQVVTAMDSIDSGGNTNWTFTSSGMTNTWTGSSNTSWGVAANWELGRAPVALDSVRIPTAARYPVLDSARSIAGLEVESGARVSLGGCDLTVNGEARVAGLLTAVGLERLVLNGKRADFTGATVTPAYSTVLFSGGGAQTGVLAGCTFWNVRVANTAGVVTLNGGVLAKEIRCAEGTNAVGIRFEAGATVETRDFVMPGSSQLTNIVLRSTTPGSQWNLRVTGQAAVSGTDVQDCQAGSGKTVYPLASRDSGNNENWAFGAAWGSWLGGSSTSFTNPANWSPAAVPGPDTLVLVDVTNALNINTSATVRALFVGGGTATAQVTVASSLTVREDLVVRTNGTLTVNQPVTVSNDVLVLNGGVITHARDAQLWMTVGSNLHVDAGAAFDANQKGYTTGPGCPTTSRSGGSHAGVGGYHYQGDGALGNTYGYVKAPTNAGSVGGTAAGGFTTIGGGAIRLVVGGVTRLEGGLLASGGDAGLNNFTAGGSGGSVFLTTGSLEGSGAIRANGGQALGSSSGGGGRVSVIVLKSNSLDRVAVMAAGGVGGWTNGGAGTFYRETTLNVPGRGSVTIDNNNQGGQATHVPALLAASPDDLARVTAIVTNRATVLSTTNMVVGELLVYTNSSWSVTNCTLSVNTREHSLEDPLRPGPGATNRVDHYDQVLWLGRLGGACIVLY